MALTFATKWRKEMYLKETYYARNHILRAWRG